MGEKFIDGRNDEKAKKRATALAGLDFAEELKKIIPRIEELEKIPKALEALAAQLKKAEFVISLLAASKK